MWQCSSSLRTTLGNATSITRRTKMILTSRTTSHKCLSSSSSSLLAKRNFQRFGTIKCNNNYNNDVTGSFVTTQSSMTRPYASCSKCITTYSRLTHPKTSGNAISAAAAAAVLIATLSTSSSQATTHAEGKRTKEEEKENGDVFNIAEKWIGDVTKDAEQFIKTVMK
eukprot:4208640-Ditylum_brightwellii.AAC.1